MRIDNYQAEEAQQGYHQKRTTSSQVHRRVTPNCSKMSSYMGTQTSEHSIQTQKFNN